MEKTPGIGARVSVKDPTARKRHRRGNSTRKLYGAYNGVIKNVPDESRQPDVAGITVLEWNKDGQPDITVYEYDNYTVKLDDGSTALVSKEQIEVL